MPYTMVKFDMQLHESWSTTLKSGFIDPFYNKMRPHIIYLRRETKKMIKSKLTSRMFHCGYIEITENNKFMQKYGKLQNEFETPEYNVSRWIVFGILVSYFIQKVSCNFQQQHFFGHCFVLVYFHFRMCVFLFSPCDLLLNTIEYRFVSTSENSQITMHIWICFSVWLLSCNLLDAHYTLYKPEVTNASYVVRSIFIRTVEVCHYHYHRSMK